jgi:hypothetical protein
LNNDAAAGCPPPRRPTVHCSGRYDANVQRRLETHTVGRNIQLYANGALNARLLSGASVP